MMKRFVRTVVVGLLTWFARAIIRKYQPTVIMVTGSVGKTSTKDAVAAALSDSFFLRKSEKSQNSEFGVPFTIIGAKAPWKNPFKWLRVFQQAAALLILPSHYPKLLVLEVGADRPGDLARILHVVTPDAVVVTRLPEVPVHVEAYATPQAVRDEEFAPAYALPPSAPLIISADDPYAQAMAKRIPAQTITYGFDKSADVRLSRIRASRERGRVTGMQAEVHIGETVNKLSIPGAVGRPQLLPAAAALAVAQAFDAPLEDVLVSLTSYTPPPGRGRVFEGVRGSTIIDDTYNSSPAAVEEALATLHAIPHANRRIAILGDMLELGRYSVEEHRRIGQLAAAAADIVVSVGVRARGIADAAREAGTPEESLLTFDTAADAAKPLAELAEEGDVFLVKGSQSVRTERIVRALLANASDVSALVRQERAWQRIG